MMDPHRVTAAQPLPLTENDRDLAHLSEVLRVIRAEGGDGRGVLARINTLLDVRLLMELTW